MNKHCVYCGTRLKQKSIAAPLGRMSTCRKCGREQPEGTTDGALVTGLHYLVDKHVAKQDNLIFYSRPDVRRSGSWTMKLVVVPNSFPMPPAPTKLEARKARKRALKVAHA